MTLAPGTRLGPYEITAKLGEGGMGEVWRATDSRLKREVAIKVLPQAFTADPERLARFEREAQLLAQLHHPNIASIFGLEESGGVRALVMELVEGPTLAERLERGALPLEEALPIARQIAEALEAAHEKGIVHRDLKPANVKLAADDKVKVLDFGLAKAMDPTAGSGSPSTSPTLMNSPTLTAAGTQLGVILGTAAYMSPEQAKGVEVDKRADVWAFGVVLWEMIAGRRLFVGATVSETLAAVLRDPVDLGALPAATPPSVRRLLARCLERNPRQRLRDIGEARFALDEAAAEPETVVVPAASARSAGLRLLPWTATLLALALAAWALWGRGDTTHHDVSHLDLAFPPELEPVDTLAGAVDISPDGRVVAMIGATEGRRRLYLRRLDRASAIELSDPSGVNAVAFSPDSASVAILSGSAQITRVSLVDQQRVVLAPGADLDSSLAWGASGICFQRDGELWLVPASGGSPRQLTRLDAARHEVVHADPLVLPDGRTVLFSSRSSEPGGDRIEAVSVAGGARSTVVDNAIGPIWSPTGHLLFARDGSLLAAPFDPRQPTRIGTALPVIAAGEVGTLRWGSLALRLSATGTLLAVPPTFNFKRLVSVARDGVEKALDLPAASWSIPRVSPDGRRVLLAKTNSTVEALDLVRGTTTQLAAATFATSFPAWTADGRYAAFRRGGVPYWVAADGSGRLGVFPGATLNDYPNSPGPDADLELMVRVQAVTGGDIYLLSLSGRAPPRAVLASPAYEGGPELSPDRAWLVYQSNESGRPEIYVRRFPAVDRAWQISEGGGIQPRWRADGKEIYYRGGGKIVAVTFDPSSSEPVLGRPTALFDDQYDIGPGLSSANYDVTSDGKFLFFRRTPTGGRLQVVLNWTDELKRLVAAGGVR